MAFETSNHNSKNMHTYYKVGGRKFYSDLQALKHFTQLMKKKGVTRTTKYGAAGENLSIGDLAGMLAKKGMLEFCIDRKMMNDDWTTEPPHALEHYLQQMCAHVENNYDEIIVGYSGGTDSNTIVDCFKRRRTRGIRLLNVVNDETQVQAKSRQYLNRHTQSMTQARHGKDAAELGWDIDMFKTWTPTRPKQFEKDISDYKYGQWDSDWKNVSGWYQNSGEMTLTRSKTNRACFIMGYEKPEIEIEDGWFVYKVNNHLWDLPINCTDPNVDVIYFFVDDGAPDLIKKLSHLKAVEMEKIMLEDHIKPTTENLRRLFRCQSTSPYIDRINACMGFKAVSDFLQGGETKRGGKWSTEDALERMNIMMNNKDTVSKMTTADRYFDDVISKQINHKFLDMENRNIKSIDGKSIPVRKVAPQLLDFLKE